MRRIAWKPEGFRWRNALPTECRMATPWDMSRALFEHQRILISAPL
ncbi:hypothetical protein [Brevundimonas naejangsanensis]|nr:hypothetical protein [Brevundimonas naejangsanensis]